MSDPLRPGAGSPALPLLLALYALMVVLWGSNFLFTSLALRSFEPLLVVEIRMGLATLALGGYVLVTRKPLPRSRALWLHFVALGLIGIGLPYALLTWAQVWVPSSIAVTLSSTTPIFVFVIAVLVTRSERFRPLRLLGIVIAFSGIVLLTGIDGSATVSWLWPTLIIVSSVLYATANVYTRAFVRSVDPAVTAFLQIGFGTLWLVPATVAVSHGPVGPVRLDSLLAVIEMGPIGTAFTFVLFFYFIKNWGSSAASLNTYLQPIVGVTLGVAVLGERLHPSDWAALLTVLAGVGLFGWTSLRAARLGGSQGST